MKLYLTLTLPSVLGLLLGQMPKASVAQVIPDTSLPVPSVVAPHDNIFIIDGGTTAGGNLFHSFQEFSLPVGSEAFFNNAPNIENIFTRVTGGNISHIDGLIRANGSANLFLLNPNGIVFGPNARLEIGGSFFGTTAQSIYFAKGSEFGVQNPQATPLLSINVPIGLHFGANPAGITVQGTGHRTISALFTPIDRSQNPIGLQVEASHTLGLIGGLVNFSGGIASVDGGGHIEIGSVAQGFVGLNATPTGWLGDYSRVRQFSDIHLAQRSLLDASGSKSSMQVYGRNIDLSEGSAALIQNIGSQPSGGITVNATESLNLRGAADSVVNTPIRIDNLGTASGGDITLSAKQLWLDNGGQVWNVTFAEAPGGNIGVNVSDSIEIDGVVPLNPAIPSTIVTFAFNSGDAGHIAVATSNLRILNSGNISSTTAGVGNGGMIEIDVKDSIEIAGNNPITLAPSAIVTSSISSGNANSTAINTSRLLVREGGLVGSTIFATGSAGSVTINARESVEITGRAIDSIIPSRIASTAQILDPVLQATYKLPPIPIGHSGSVTINTSSLHIADDAYVTVNNDGPGRAGDLEINATSASLNRQGSITASTASGNGGNLRLNLQDYLQLRHHSLVSATAAGTGDGGNLSVNAPVLVGLENSDVVANAVRGKGGNIKINTQGIFGLENRLQLTPDSDLSASSQFGVDGVVTITNPEVDPGSSLVNFSQETIDPAEQVVAGCQWTGESEFIATGRGGVPASPNRPVWNHRTWSDVRDLSAFRGERVEARWVPVEKPERLQEATGWVVNEDGTVMLVAATDSAQTGNFLAAPCNPLSHNR